MAAAPRGSKVRRVLVQIKCKAFKLALRCEAEVHCDEVLCSALCLRGGAELGGESEVHCGGSVLCGEWEPSPKGAAGPQAWGELGAAPWAPC